MITSVIVIVMGFIILSVLNFVTNRSQAVLDRSAVACGVIGAGILIAIIMIVLGLGSLLENALRVDPFK